MQTANCKCKLRGKARMGGCVATMTTVSWTEVIKGINKKGQKQERVKKQLVHSVYVCSFLFC